MKATNEISMDNEQPDALTRIAEQFQKLPKVVRDAILSADVETHMRQLADSHKLHYDQWAALENETMFALLGLTPIEDLAKNIEHEVGIPANDAEALAADISHIVFEPIRAQLEAALEYPQEEKGPEAVSEQTVVDEHAQPEVPVAEEHPLAQIVPAIAPIFAGTPPAPPPEKKAVRAPISASYDAGQASHERKVVEGDPYREQPA